MPQDASLELHLIGYSRQSQCDRVLFSQHPAVHCPTRLGAAQTRAESCSGSRRVCVASRALWREGRGKPGRGRGGGRRRGRGGRTWWRRTNGRRAPGSLCRLASCGDLVRVVFVGVQSDAATYSTNSAPIILSPLFFPPSFFPVSPPPVCPLSEQRLQEPSRSFYGLSPCSPAWQRAHLTNPTHRQMLDMQPARKHS